MTQFKYNATDRLKVKEWEEIYFTNTKYKKAGVALLIVTQSKTLRQAVFPEIKRDVS